MISFRRLLKVFRTRISRRHASDVFAEWACRYDDDNNPLIEAEQPVMQEMLGDLSDAAVLDLGCGTGRLMRLAEQHGARRVVGLDRCEEMLSKVQGVRVRGDMTLLPFGTASFDCVIAGLAVGYVASLDVFVREAARVLRPGGRLICSDLHPCGYWMGWQRTYRRVDGRTAVVPCHVYSFSDIHRAVRTAGLELIDVREARALRAPPLGSECPAALVWMARLPTCD